MLTILCRVAYHAPNWTKDCQKIQVWKNWKYLWVYYLPSSTQFFTDRRNKSVTLLRDWTSWLQVPAAFLRWSDWRSLSEFLVINLPTKFLTTQQIKVVTESNNSMREDMQEEIAACLKRNENFTIRMFLRLTIPRSSLCYHRIFRILRMPAGFFLPFHSIWRSLIFLRITLPSRYFYFKLPLCSAGSNQKIRHPLSQLNELPSS